MPFPLGQCPLPPDDIVIENAQFVYRPNFEGREERFNDEGDRYFNVRIPDNIVDKVTADGWNIKWTKPSKSNPRPEEHIPEPYLEVNVGFKYRPPTILVIENGQETQLTVDEEKGIDTVRILDGLEFEQFDVVIRGRNWENEASKQCGIKAWLKTFVGVVNVDEVLSKYARLREDAQA
jgi:hypothetical protein